MQVGRSVGTVADDLRTLERCIVPLALRSFLPETNLRDVSCPDRTAMYAEPVSAESGLVTAYRNE